MAFVIEEINNAGYPEQVDGPVHISELRLVVFDHYNFSGEIKSGRIIIHRNFAKDASDIFRELYEMKFPIQQAVTIDNYNSDDVASMEDNNTSGFNCRRIMNTGNWSSHAYGTAIDINPMQNPYVLIDHDNGTAKIYPRAGSAYLNRSITRPGMVEDIVRIFARHGFTAWGGAWESPLDYHHFQVPWDVIEKLVR